MSWRRSVLLTQLAGSVFVGRHAEELTVRSAPTQAQQAP